MGFAALHIAKASGNDSGMSAHIERKPILKMPMKKEHI